MKSAIYALCGAIMSETVHNTTSESILHSCLLHDAERDLLAIAKFLVFIVRRKRQGNIKLINGVM